VIGNAALLALVAVVPLVVLALTSFVKLSVVLSLARNAIGAPDAPSGLVVTGLSLVLTFFVMAPIAVDMVHAAATPTAPAQRDDTIRSLVPHEYQAQVDTAERAIEPLRQFLAKHATTRDRETFVDLARRLGRFTRGDELWVLAPAFITSELRAAFAMAVLVFIPFLVIDLVVALGLASLGLPTTKPHAVALPLKLLLFVSVDGWRLLVEGLVRGYA
jgi:type III secretion protein R